MTDIFSIKPWDIVEYGPYICSASLKDKRSIGFYQDFMLWSPDERPLEMWLNLTNVEGQKIFIRASQVTNVFPATQKGQAS